MEPRFDTSTYELGRSCLKGKKLKELIKDKLCGKLW